MQEHLSVHDLRKYVGWCFAVECLLDLEISFRHIVYSIHRYGAFPPLRSLLDATSFLVMAAICGVAWWAVWKGNPSARGWGIAASLTYVLIFLRSVAFPPRSIWGHMGALVVGTIGMVAFLRPDERHDPSKNSKETADSGSSGPCP
jgi:hypothetical protein